MAAVYCQKEDAVYGRGLYATRRVRAGSEVLAEVPIVHVVKMAHKACQRCLHKPHDTPLLGCAGCNKSVWYCGKDCQRKDWPYHREECKGMAELGSMEVKVKCEVTAQSEANQVEQDMNTIRLLVRAVCTKDVVFNLSSLVCEDPVRTESVVAYMLLADLMVVNKRHRRGIADLVREKYEREVASGTSVETICNRILSSYFSIHDYKVGQDNGENIGRGIYPQCCMLNHSCEPNCVWVSDGRNMVVRTVRDVAVGEQFFISYINVYRFEKHNKAFMLRHFGFVPCCKHCDLPDKDLRSDLDHVTRIDALFNAQKWQAVIDYSGGPIKSTLAAIRIAEIQFDAHGKLQNYEKAVKCAHTFLDLTRERTDSVQWMRWWKLFQVQYQIWKSSPDVSIIHDELMELHMGHPCDYHFDIIAVSMKEKGVTLEAALATFKKALIKGSPFMAAVSALQEAVKMAVMTHGHEHALTKACEELHSHTEQFVQEVIPLIQRAILRKMLETSNVIPFNLELFGRH